MYAKECLFLPSKINLGLIKSSLKRANDTLQCREGGQQVCLSPLVLVTHSVVEKLLLLQSRKKKKKKWDLWV